ncbi:prepilin peptidase [Sporosarcina sp. ACRSL]|uniref:A24 family peptidase n=1 Tax=Sporosarcina sp. ACRSL TaxID=2918215 RepID=UPI001EF6AB6C|nr:prepilin peptidase [Sporosarcina sp. ACRSL]MCG7344134.1 prepilin peptidase [Sporosarcina sp. ACRSL]
MANIALAVILIISVVTDVRSRKVLNIITLPAILTGFLFHVVTSGLDGFFFSGIGFLVGLGLLIIPFIMGGIGAGDVKLLAAIGAWKGAVFVFYATLYGAAIGGLIALFILLKRKRLGFTIKHILFSFRFLKNRKVLGDLGETDGTLSIPYAVPIAVGALIAFLMEVYI